MGIGAGQIYFVLAATTVTLLVLLFFPRLESRIDKIREARSYRIVLGGSNFKAMDKVQKAIEDCSLKVFDHHQTKTEKTIINSWKTIGSPKNHERFVLMMLRDKAVRELDY